MRDTKDLERYAEYLSEEELSDNTRRIYIKQADLFLDFLGERNITKKETIAYKKHLLEQNRKATSTNLYLVAVNRYLKYAGFGDYVMKTGRLQKRQCPDNIITMEEYRKMLAYAQKTGRKKYYCIMRMMALTGIRVSELSGCTVEALEEGKFSTSNKGRTREIYLPDKLVAELKEYCDLEHIGKGVIFKGNTEQPISRVAVYKMLVYLADRSGVPREKAHPHSFRHLFAVTYMQRYSNLFELADILGHSSLETTRIYTATTAEAKRKRMNELKL